jgi:hypothetical protein
VAQPPGSGPCSGAFAAGLGRRPPDLVRETLDVEDVVDRDVVADDGATEPPGANVIDGIQPGGAADGPKVPHVFTRMRNAGFSMPKARITSSSSAWITSEWPSPPNLSSSMSVHTRRASRPRR